MAIPTPRRVVTGDAFWHRERIGLTYSTATRQIPEFRGRYRGRGHDYLMMQKPEGVRAFLIKYQDRVVYGTDNLLYPSDTTGDVL